ncbi:MAG: hypothetical protein AMXMBFR48_23990 [Ignavibacteriales bacterium]|jgi:DNA-binding MurR/RpiR family transcriptional regulator
MPRNMNADISVKDLITTGYADLPKSQKKIADYILENFDKIPFHNVNELSRLTSSSVASITRFAQRIGMDGYIEMREKISLSLQHKIKNKSIFPLFDAKNLKDDTLTAVANLDIKNIGDTLARIDRDHFNRTISRLLKARKVYTAGLGISYLLAEILAYQLNQVGIDAAVMNHTWNSFPESLVYKGAEDYMILISFPPYSKETIETAKCAGEQGIGFTAITDKHSAPFTFYTDTVLTVNSENMLYTNSFSAISVLINAIATECALKNKKKSSQILEKLDKFSKTLDLVLE